MVGIENRTKGTKTLCAGDRIGNLTLLHKDGQDERRSPYWLCLCDCGNTKKIRADNLKAGRTNSCGCQRYATTGRPNQMSMRKLPQKDIVFTAKVYESGKRDLGTGAPCRWGFAKIEREGEGFTLTNCTNRHTKKGQVDHMYHAVMNRLYATSQVSERGSLSYPEWAKREGVQLVIKDRNMRPEDASKLHEEFTNDLLYGN